MTIRLVLCHRHIRTVYFKRRTEIMAVYFSRWSFSLLILPFPLGPEIQSETDLSSSLWLFQLSVKEMGQESGNLESAFGIYLSSFTNEVNKRELWSPCEAMLDKSRTFHTLFMCVNYQILIKRNWSGSDCHWWNMHSTVSSVKAQTT